MIFAPGGQPGMPFPFPGGYAPGGMPQRLFPDFVPGPSSIDTSYGADGSVKTTTQAPGMPMSSGPYQQLMGMVGGGFRKPKPMGLGKKTTNAQVMQGPGERVNALPTEAPWYSQQGAAMRPIGLGAQMIPGMAPDPRFLPPGMRPEKSELKPADRIENATGGRPAGLSPQGPSAQQQANALGGSSNGYDYLPPAEQARWAAALGRSNAEAAARRS